MSVMREEGLRPAVTTGRDAGCEKPGSPGSVLNDKVTQVLRGYSAVQGNTDKERGIASRLSKLLTGLHPDRQLQTLTHGCDQITRNRRRGCESLKEALSDRAEHDAGSGGKGRELGEGSEDARRSTERPEGEDLNGKVKGTRQGDDESRLQVSKLLYSENGDQLPSKPTKAE